MNPLKWATALGIGTIVLAGCATPPEGPTVHVMPAPGKPFEVFVAEDRYCQSYAAQSTGNATEASNTAAVGSAVAGTALGAAAGALIGGNSQGAGIGAGMGLLMGSAAGSNQSARGGYSAQQRYNIAYEQCMYAKGNILPGQPIPYYHSMPPPPPAPYAPPSGSYPPPPSSYPPPPPPPPQ